MQYPHSGASGSSPGNPRHSSIPNSGIKTKMCIVELLPISKSLPSASLWLRRGLQTQCLSPRSSDCKGGPGFRGNREERTFSWHRKHNLPPFPHSHVPTFSRSHIHTFPHSHVPTFSRSHVPTFTRSHIHTFSLSHIPTFTRSHIHTFTRSHVLTFSAGKDLRPGHPSPARHPSGPRAGYQPRPACRVCPVAGDGILSGSRGGIRLSR
jgi:hypothetical protein